MDVGPNEVTAALQDACSGLLRAVELERRRADGTVDIAAVVSDIHEPRTIMSAAAQMMRSFNLERYGQMVKWCPAGESDGFVPREYLEAAGADFGEAYEHLQRAAEGLTSTRRRLAVLH